MSSVDHRERMRLVKADANADALKIDGQPFDGKHVGAMFGNVLASLAALADTADAILERLDELPDDLFVLDDGRIGIRT